MTAPKHFTQEQVRTHNRERARLYRSANREKFREADRKRYPSRQQKRRERIYGTQKCAQCEILLVSKYGANGTKIYCASCKKDSHKLYMRRYRAKKKGIRERKEQRLAKQTIVDAHEKVRGMCTTCNIPTSECMIT